MFRRFDIRTEVLLALIPTGVVIGVLLLLQAFARQQILFSSLASSAFLIYLDPKHPVNHVRTLAIAQMGAAVIGYVFFISLGPGYTSAALSMVLTIALMITTKAMHPPAVATALIFAFQYSRVNTLVLFLLAIFLLVLLLFLQRVSIWLIRKAEGKNISLNKALQDERKSETLNRAGKGAAAGKRSVRKEKWV